MIGETSRGALRVIPAETRLTVYRRRPVLGRGSTSFKWLFFEGAAFFATKMKNESQFGFSNTSSLSDNKTIFSEGYYANNGKLKFQFSKFKPKG